VAITTALTRQLAINAPILLAPMGGVSGGALAAAVTQAGGLGIIGGGYGNREWLSRELDAAGNAEIGVGFITWSLAKDPDLLSIALDRRPRVMFLSFGDLAPFAGPIARAGIPLIAQVQTVADARAAVDLGAQIVVAQGTEAGGHGATRATLPLVPAVVDAIGPVPVVAAGGIADGRGLAAALMLGAAGALCGTAFYASTESLAHPAAKRTAVAASGDHTVRGTVVDVVRGYAWPERWNIRTLENAFSRRWSGDVDGLKRDLERQSKAYAAAQEAGDMDTAAVIIGEAVDLVRASESARDIVQRMTVEAEARLRAGERLIDTKR
jgi:nitronate monooxygenase